MIKKKDLNNLFIEMFIILLYCSAGFMFFAGFNILLYLAYGEFYTPQVLMSIFLIPYFIIVIQSFVNRVGFKSGY